MIDLKKHEYEEQEYQKFLRYVKGTFGELLNLTWFDWVEEEEITIKKVIISNYKNVFEVFVYLNGNPLYYDYNEDRELVKVAYDGKAIKTNYYLSSEDILYIMLKGTLLKDLGLEDVEVVISDFTDGLEINKDLTKELEQKEQSYAETMYCIEHDL